MTPRESGSAEDSDRRTGERMEILGDLQGEVMVYRPMTVQEISHGGAQIETSFPLLLDSLHDLRLDLAGVFVAVKGRIVHCAIADMDHAFVNYRSGLEFIQLEPVVRDAISSFIAETKAGRLAR